MTGQEPTVSTHTEVDRLREVVQAARDLDWCGRLQRAGVEGDLMRLAEALERLDGQATS